MGRPSNKGKKPLSESEQECLERIFPYNQHGLVQKVTGPCWSYMDQDKIEPVEKDHEFVTTYDKLTPIHLLTEHPYRYHFGLFSPTLQEVAKGMIKHAPIEYWRRYQTIYVRTEPWKFSRGRNLQLGKTTVYGVGGKGYAPYEKPRPRLRPRVVKSKPAPSRPFRPNANFGTSSAAESFVLPSASDFFGYAPPPRRIPAPDMVNPLPVEDPDITVPRQKRPRETTTAISASLNDFKLPNWDFPTGFFDSVAQEQGSFQQREGKRRRC